ncbi:unnamed protein product [Prorocentrum cordatum]|uniref:Uncharacterized protein n=1 Tax=Prorocentrum cordatum TaxID=2364126 RepID=A0ABN9TWL5_9DINO|nr:unnamed protein product [Polarella glacialis]
MKRLKRSRALRRWRATGEDAETKKEDGKDGNEGKKENEADKPEALADAGWIIQEPYVSDVLDAAKAASGLPVSAVDFVEMCGGCSRVPWVKEMCSQAFGGKELSTTMNADECVARGCTLQDAVRVGGGAAAARGSKTWQRQCASTSPASLTRWIRGRSTRRC